MPLTSPIREPLLFNEFAEMASAGRRVAGRLPRRLTLAFLVAGLTPAGCYRYVEVYGDSGPQAYYRTGFPVRDVSGALERVAASVVRILVQRSYVTYLSLKTTLPRRCSSKAREATFAFLPWTPSHHAKPRRRRAS